MLKKEYVRNEKEIFALSKKIEAFGLERKTLRDQLQELKG